MAKVFFVGLQNIDFDDRKTGDHIEGLKLHINYLDDNVMGLKADSKFINHEACKNLGFTVDSLAPLIGHEVELETNLKGSVTGVRPVAESA